MGGARWTRGGSQDRGRSLRADGVSWVIWGDISRGAFPQTRSPATSFPVAEGSGRRAPSWAQGAACLGVGCKGSFSDLESALVGLPRVSTCSAVMADPFCVGAGRRLPGSSKSGPGKDGSRNEVRLPVRHDPPKLGKRGSGQSQLQPVVVSSAARGPPPCSSTSGWPGGLPGLLRAFPGWAQPRALGSCSRLTVPFLLCLSKTQSRPDQRSGWQGGCGERSLQGRVCRVLQGCRWPGAGSRYPARPRSASTREAWPATGRRGRRRGVRKPRTRPSETFP